MRAANIAARMRFRTPTTAFEYIDLLIFKFALLQHWIVSYPMSIHGESNHVKA